MKSIIIKILLSATILVAFNACEGGTTQLSNATKKTDQNSGDNSGNNSENHSKNKTDNNSGNDSADSSSNNSGDNSGNDSGDNSGNNSGNDSGNNSGDNSGNNSGNNSGDNSGNDSGDSTDEQVDPNHTVVDIKVSASSDDAEEASNGDINLQSSDLEMTLDKSRQSVGIRFNNVIVPKNAKIISAYMQFSVDESSTSSTNLTIYGEKALNSKTFSNSRKNITLRDKTLKNVKWLPAKWESVGDRTKDQRTPDLKLIIQEIVDQSEWYSKNAISFIIDGYGKRVAVSYDKSSKEAPSLHIVYMLQNVDTDGDGKNDDVDNDDDGDGVLDKDDAFPLDKNESVDTDGDGVGNNADSDDDNDGVSDEDEIKAGTDPLDKDDHPAMTTTIEPVVKVAKYHRVVWDKDPSTKAIVAFTPDTNSDTFYIKYGQSDDETTWVKNGVDEYQKFDRNLKTYFARLTGLSADKGVYYRICDDSNCGERLWFRTAPTGEKPFVVVAGGDTRSGWSNRRDGNILLAKIRPLFVMHGGDFTSKNNYSQMEQFLEDWKLSFSDDKINGVDYKRIYPIVPTHGNHEDNNPKTLCEVFGLDANGDGECQANDTYGAFNVSSLLRVYTLNSQFQYSGKSSLANEMNNWFNDDIVSKSQDVKWRIAQYHKPMFPHYTGKPDNPTLFNWWADKFYDYGMNLVVESDTHIVKNTKIVKPASSGTDYVEAPNGGTLYVGEGSWGAEARSANDSHSWTQDMGAFQQFKVIVVKKDTMDVRTAKFDGSVSALSKAQRDSDSVKLPTGIDWWSVKGRGTSTLLKRNSNKQSIYAN